MGVGVAKRKGGVATGRGSPSEALEALRGPRGWEAPGRRWGRGRPPAGPRRHFLASARLGGKGSRLRGRVAVKRFSAEPGSSSQGKKNVYLITSKPARLGIATLPCFPCPPKCLLLGAEARCWAGEGIHAQLALPWGCQSK